MSLAEAADLLRCPACHGPLDLDGATARCPAGHAYDVARQGYLNLLGGPQPRNADTAEMLGARTRVLDGVYADVVSLVAQTVASLEARVVVDAGAGTGQYLAAALDALPDAVGVATDVSVQAARRSARAHARIAAVVADTWKGVPLRDGVADAVCCVFAPRHGAEFARVLRPGGHLVVVTPAPGHLASVRAAYHLLDLDDRKDERLEATLADWFTLEATDRLTQTVTPSPDQLADVVAMGPNAFHHAEHPASEVPLEIDVVCRTYRLRTSDRRPSKT